ncbi:YeeE/YedE family protein [Pseudooceanicola algae]|uniref:Sulphur transport domain-containing protein n=1 Tax=Pseudooceanicola algae TaxID=1537215 RepID=A0A418SE13_9RHOB|nr:YeeE/YedE family protein [Pseudooceanicola algae]QPM89601.1 hypothetical protein PSAL_008220 [Pseudooceanicola algae]
MTETAFTPLVSAAGGALIGLAAVALLALFGRIMGATGILAGAVIERPKGDTSWRWALLAGMVTAPLLYLITTGGLPVVTVTASTPMLVIGGLLVGLGVTFGGGCTSGHGICGMARLSPRSLVATVSFMIATLITVYLVRHVFGG